MSLAERPFRVIPPPTSEQIQEFHDLCFDLTKAGDRRKNFQIESYNFSEDTTFIIDAQFIDNPQSRHVAQVTILETVKNFTIEKVYFLDKKHRIGSNLTLNGKTGGKLRFQFQRKYKELEEKFNVVSSDEVEAVLDDLRDLYQDKFE